MISTLECPLCGTEVEEQEEYCPECGETLKNSKGIFGVPKSSENFSSTLIKKY